MSMKQYKHGSIYGGRHIRKKTRRGPPVPVRRQNPDKRNDEDYANVGHRHRLTHLRYPTGSGKRPPPKPKRLYVLQEESGSPSPPPHAAPVASPRNRGSPGPPNVAPPPKPAARTKPPGLFPHDGGASKSAPPIPPKLHSKLTSLEEAEEEEEEEEPAKKLRPPPKRPVEKRRPPKPRASPPKPPPPGPKPTDDGSDVEISSMDILGAMRNRAPPKPKNGVIEASPLGVEHAQFKESLPLPPRQQQQQQQQGAGSRATPPAVKQPLLPPTVKPRRAKPEVAKQDDDRPTPNLPQLPPKPTHLLPQKKENSPTPPPPLPVSPQRRRPPPVPGPTSVVTSPQQRKAPPLPPPQSSAPPPTTGRLPKTMSEPQMKVGVTGKAPLPRPRVRKLSEESAGSGSSPQPHQNQEGCGTGSAEGGVTAPPTRRHPVAVRTTSADKLAAVLVRQNVRNEEMMNSSPAPPTSFRPRPLSTEKAVSLQMQTDGGRPDVEAREGRGLGKAPPVPRKRKSKDMSAEPVQAKKLPPPPSSSSSSALSQTPAGHQSSLRARKKGGGIRMALWKAPPPPPCTPPPTPNMKQERRKIPPHLQLADLTVTPTSPPYASAGAVSSTSFILPPFSSSDILLSPPASPYPEPGGYEQPISLTRPISLSPVPTTPKSPLALEFEEKLFEFKTPRGPGYQQQLPKNVVQELQSNLRKQITRRSGMA